MRGLNLSDAQRQQIAGIMKNARARNQDADPQTRRANALALRTQIEGVLTDAQRTELRLSWLSRKRTESQRVPRRKPHHSKVLSRSDRIARTAVSNWRRRSSMRNDPRRISTPISSCSSTVPEIFRRSWDAIAIYDLEGRVVHGNAPRAP